MCQGKQHMLNKQGRGFADKPGHWKLAEDSSWNLVRNTLENGAFANKYCFTKKKSIDLCHAIMHVIQSKFTRGNPVLFAIYKKTRQVFFMW